MILTKKTLITWTSAEAARLPDIVAARIATLEEMTSVGKTDGTYVAISDREFERHWVDQAAAQEYINEMIADAAPHGNIIVSAVIQDI